MGDVRLFQIWAMCHMEKEVDGMGRKESGSLFHQLIHAPGVFTLADRRGPDGGEMDVSFKTRENYYTWLHKAADYFKNQGIRSVSQIGKAEVQAYADMLAAKELSASTIHSYLAPVCKAAGLSMAEVTKPLRYASEFIRSGGDGKKDGGRPGELNSLIGIRENELRHLRGNDIIERNGDTFVVVRQGKGGKYQEQRILPDDVEQVKSFFDGSERKIFRADEFVSGFDYHGQRRAAAMRALEYYNHKLQTEPDYRKQLYQKVADQWHRNNRKHRDKLEPLSYFNRPYILRGQNRELAKKQGKPIVLDRLALRAVSVLHLAHWRDKVTVQSYYFNR